MTDLSFVLGLYIGIALSSGAVLTLAWSIYGHTIPEPVSWRQMALVIVVASLTWPIFWPWALRRTKADD